MAKTGFIVLLAGLFFSLAGQAYAGDAQAEIVPSSLIEARANHSQVLRRGYLQSLQSASRVNSIHYHDRDGVLRWTYNLGLKRMVSAAELDNELFIVVVSYKAGDRYLDGRYALLHCRFEGECRQTLQFEDGVFDVDAKGHRLFVLEYDITELDYGIEAPPVFSRKTNLTVYSNNTFSPVVSYPRNGMRALDADNTEKVFVEFLFDGTGETDRLGVYSVFTGEQIDGFRPLKRTTNRLNPDADHYYQPRCEDFLYDRFEGLLACILPYHHAGKARRMYQVMIIDRNGDIAGEITSPFLPYRDRTNKLMVVDPEGRKLPITSIVVR